MQISVGKVKTIFEDLVANRISREDADKWAGSHIAQAEKITFSPSDDKDVIWEALTFLHGIDLLVEQGKYLHSDDEIEKKLHELF